MNERDYSLPQAQKKFEGSEKISLGDQKIDVTFFLFRHTLAVRYLSPLE